MNRDFRNRGHRRRGRACVLAECDVNHLRSTELAETSADCNKVREQGASKCTILQVLRRLGFAPQATGSTSPNAATTDSASSPPTEITCTSSPSSTPHCASTK